MVKIFIMLLLLFVVGGFCIYGIYHSLYPVYPTMTCLRLITKEAAFTTVTKGMRNREVYDKDGKIRSEIQRKIDGWQDEYLVFLRNHISDFEEVLLKNNWLNEKHQIKSRRAVKISNDFLKFYEEIQEKA